MIKLKPDTKIYIGTEPVDMRKSINGLSILVVETLDKSPQCGHVFIFYNKRRNKVKLILWDKNGFVLIYKQIQKGRFKFAKDAHRYQTHYEIDQEQLAWLLAGFDFINLKHYPELNASYYS